MPLPAPRTKRKAPEQTLTVKSLRNHPNLKNRDDKTLYMLDDRFYVVTKTGLHVVNIEAIAQINLMGPYREVVRLTTRPTATTELREFPLEYLYIDFEDAARVFYHCERLGASTVNVGLSLVRFNEFTLAQAKLNANFFRKAPILFDARPLKDKTSPHKLIDGHQFGYHVGNQNHRLTAKRQSKY